MNTLVGKKLSAVSHKVNTTRLEILGVKNVGETQLVFHDTPDLIRDPKLIATRKKQIAQEIPALLRSQVPARLGVNSRSAWTMPASACSRSPR